ncbi:AraC family transcriptional regulator [Clostridium swellfunianum]|uniref:AraC family transcriptional regulator n=1 Tax=Clostridium swellfunianum TaxID=1367462 RepID=UPI00202E1369|nr:helix-turn-helix domain-containing protein [Clostridium swellfunianum]MCM0649358.1 AraC family transcriptional regulator [Clostridium swellfunianum]
MYIKEPGVLQNSSAFFHTPSSIAKSIFFYLKCAGHYFCTKGYSVKRDNYDSYLFMYIKSGNGFISYDNKVFTAKANDVVLLNCNKPHGYSTENWETLWIHFDGNMSSQYFNLIYDSFGCIFSLRDNTLIQKNLSIIINSFISNKDINEPLISCYIQRMLTELFQLHLSNNADGLDNSSSPIALATSYIQENFKNKIILEEVASKVNLSVFYFSRLFKKEMGYSPYEYILMTRINEAKKLLKGSTLLVKEVAFATGFSSESSFVTSFKKHTKLTPMSFRDTPV